MRKYLKSLIKEVVSEVLEEKIGRIVRLSAEASHRDLFAYISIARLKELIKTSEESEGDKYTCLSELFTRTARENLAKDNSDIIHSYYELLPRLDAYKKSFNKVIE